jgi:hypothetical protein
VTPLVFALLYGYLLTSTCQAAFSLSVSPYLLEFEVPGGGVRTFTMTLYNEGNGPAEVKAYTRSLHLSLTGEPQPGDGMEGIFSCAPWISLRPSHFTIQPNGKEKVAGILEVPRGQRGGRYASILFETVPKEVKGGLRISTRLGVVVMMTILRTLRKKGEIVNFSSSPVEEGMSLKAIFCNTGNVHLKATSTVVIMDSEGKVVDRVNLQGGTGTVLPLEKREFSGRWTRRSKMSPGKEYIAEVRVVFPGGRWVRERFDFTLPREKE